MRNDNKYMEAGNMKKGNVEVMKIDGNLFIINCDDTITVMKDNDSQPLTEGEGEEVIVRVNKECCLFCDGKGTAIRTDCTQCQCHAVDINDLKPQETEGEGKISSIMSCAKCGEDLIKILSDDIEISLKHNCEKEPQESNEKILDSMLRENIKNVYQQQESNKEEEERIKKRTERCLQTGVKYCYYCEMPKNGKGCKICKCHVKEPPKKPSMTIGCMECGNNIEI